MGDSRPVRRGSSNEHSSGGQEEDGDGPSAKKSKLANESDSQDAAETIKEIQEFIALGKAPGKERRRQVEDEEDKEEERRPEGSDISSLHRTLEGLDENSDNSKVSARSKASNNDIQSKTYSNLSTLASVSENHDDSLRKSSAKPVVGVIVSNIPSNLYSSQSDFPDPLSPPSKKVTKRPSAVKNVRLAAPVAATTARAILGPDIIIKRVKPVKKSEVKVKTEKIHETPRGFSEIDKKLNYVRVVDVNDLKAGKEAPEPQIRRVTEKEILKHAVSKEKFAEEPVVKRGRGRPPGPGKRGRPRKKRLSEDEPPSSPPSEHESEIEEEPSDEEISPAIFDLHFVTSTRYAEHHDSLDSESDPENEIYSHFTKLKIEKEKNKALGKSASIYDLIKQLSIELPMWNIHTSSKGDVFYIAQVDSDDNRPVMKKVVEIDTSYRAKVFIDGKPVPELEGIYNSYDTIHNLIFQVDQL